MGQVAHQAGAQLYFLKQEATEDIASWKACTPASICDLTMHFYFKLQSKCKSTLQIDMLRHVCGITTCFFGNLYIYIYK